MANLPDGVMALYPVNLARTGDKTDEQEQNNAIAQNESNLNQDLEILYNALCELIDYLSSQSA